METTGSSQDRRRDSIGGFTIVELLVVIGIVTILIAILLPALSNARRVSQRLSCASQVRQIALASINYATDNKNRIPERWRFGTGMDNIPPGAESWIYFSSYNFNGVSANSSNIARLAETHYLSGNWDSSNMTASQATIPMLWCPAAAATPDASAGQNNTNHASSYFYNPHMCKPGTSVAYDSRYTRIDKIPHNRVLVCDLCWYPDSVFHMMDSAGMSAGWNLGFSDGHVVFIQSAELLAYIQSNYGTTSFRTAYQASNAVDFLESIADGLDPHTTSINNTGAFTKANNYGIKGTAAPYRVLYTTNSATNPEPVDQLP